VTDLLAWLGSNWVQVYPNLEAGLLQSVGTAGLVHWLHVRHARQRDRLMHVKLDAALASRAVTTSTVAGTSASAGLDAM
jgi:hypothetical protein